MSFSRIGKVWKVLRFHHRTGGFLDGVANICSFPRSHCSSSNVNFCFSSFFSLQSALQREEEEEADDEWALMCILLAAAEEPLALALEAIEQRSFSYKHLTTQTTLPVYYRVSNNRT